MKILFVLGATSRIRNFDHAITILAQRGHTLQLTGRPRKGRFGLPKTFKVDRVTARENPTARSDEWREYVDGIRGARDYVRYLAPEFAQATRLVRRAYEISPTGFVLFCERNQWLKGHWKLLASVLAYCETLIPSDPALEDFIREEKPDLMLVTPLVTFESYQTDYVKAAHRLGVPIAFLPFSWDNLTNKGLMRVQPDRVLVWNETQKQEAIDLHGARPDSVVITGAARFDDFFAREPSMTRQEFCAPYGLDPTRPFVLYLGSSQLTGPNEMDLVRRWAESLRHADDPVVRSCGILVRPHPALKSSWTTVDLSDLGNIAVSLDASRGADQELYDSLHHSHAAVGLNTSAMLEAAIVGRPVHTLLIPGFDEGQVGTIHFRYLVEAFGGLVTVTRSFTEHHTQLATLLDSPPLTYQRSRRFAENFLRPRGINNPVSPILADEIEKIAAIRKRPHAFTPPWHYPARWALRRWLRRQHTQRGDRPVEDTSPVATSMSLRPVKTALEELHQDNGPIFVGPWLDDVARELLYWIPFVRWAVHTYGLSRDRLIVVSRGGARHWYGSLAARYLDIRDLFRGAEFDDWSRRTIPQSQQNPKQAVMYPFDQEILQRAAATLDVSDFQTLHPMFFFRVLRRLEGDRQVNRIREVLIHERFQSNSLPALTNVPADYVAFSRAFTAALPDAPSNKAFLDDLFETVTADHEVVVVDETNAVDYQTHAVARAQAFIGAYGDAALLASSCGVPTFAFHSESVPPEQLELIRAVAQDGIWGALATQSVDQAQGFQLPMKTVAV